MSNFTDDLDLKKQGFIYEAVEPTSASMAFLPQNRTLFMAPLTDKAPIKPELTYDVETMEQAFDRFQPEVKVEFQDEEGASNNETLKFRSVGDFNRKSLVKNSDFLNTLEHKEKEHTSFARKLQSNKVLQKVLSDPEKKVAYITLLKSMIQELEESDLS